MQIKKAGELMIPLDDYPHIRFWDKLGDVIRIMTGPVGGSTGISPRVVLVFDELDILVGMVRRRDAMRGLEPDFLLSKPMDYRKKLFDIPADANLAELSYSKLVDGLTKKTSTPVYDIMQPIKTFVEYDDHLIKAVYAMVDDNVSLLPVIRGQKVVGVIRSEEVLTELAALTQESESQRHG